MVPPQAIVVGSSRNGRTSRVRLSRWRTESASMAQNSGNRAALIPAFIASAFERVLSRPPTGDERAQCEESLAALAELHTREKDPAPETRARAGLIHVLLNHNDFITVR